ncbi:MAG: hypothetical protein V1770_01145 [bacterium]
MEKVSCSITWFEKKGKKKFIKFLNTFFFQTGKENIMWEAIGNIVEVFKSGDQKKKEIGKDYLIRIRNRFVALPQPDFNRILNNYYSSGGVDEDGIGYSVAYDFDIANVMGYTKKGDYEGAKKLFEKVILALRSIPSPEEGIGHAKEFISSMKFLFSLIAEILITHTWINLIEAAFQGDEQAINLIKDIFSFPSRHGFGLDLVSDANWKIKLGIKDSFHSKILEEIGYLKDCQILKFPVTDDRIDFLKGLLAEVRGKISEGNKAIISILEFFQSNVENFSSLFSKMWQDIISTSRYGLRSNGKDRIDIGIKALQENGYKTMQFFCDSMDFPEVKVKCWVKLFSHLSDTYYSFEFFLKNTSLLEYNAAGLNEDDPRVWVDRLLAFISLHCYWKIAMGKRGEKIVLDVSVDRSNLIPKKRPNGRSGERGKMELKWVVRPFFRPLPKGYRPSEEAVMRSMEKWEREPPPGRTFVQEHTRGFHEMVESITSLFVYRDDDIGYN